MIICDNIHVVGNVHLRLVPQSLVRRVVGTSFDSN